MHIKAQHDTYDLKVTADMRKVFFKPHSEDSLFEKIKSSLWSIFNRLSLNEEKPVRPAVKDFTKNKKNQSLMLIKGLADFEKTQALQSSLVAIGASFTGKIKRSALLIEGKRDQSYYSKVADINSEGELSGEDATSDEEEADLKKD